MKMNNISTSMTNIEVSRCKRHWLCRTTMEKACLSRDRSTETRRFIPANIWCWSNKLSENCWQYIIIDKCMDRLQNTMSREVG